MKKLQRQVEEERNRREEMKKEGMNQKRTSHNSKISHDILPKISKREAIRKSRKEVKEKIAVFAENRPPILPHDFLRTMGHKEKDNNSLIKNKK